jgi:hypothetical protein
MALLNSLDSLSYPEKSQLLCVCVCTYVRTCTGVLGLNFRTLCLLGRCSSTWGTPQLSLSQSYLLRAEHLCPVQPCTAILLPGLPEWLGLQAYAIMPACWDAWGSLALISASRVAEITVVCHHAQPWSSFESIFFFSFFFFYFLVVLEFELKDLHLLGKCSTIWATPPALKLNFYLQNHYLRWRCGSSSRVTSRTWNPEFKSQ